MGGWTLIGYTAPGVASGDNFETTSFTYSGAITKNTAVIAATDKAWMAKNRVKLNDCAIPTGDGPWTVKVELVLDNEAPKDVKFTSAVAGDGCKALTPTFDKIGQ